MSDTLQIFGKTFSNATGIVATDNTDTERTFIRPTGTMTIDENGTYDVSEYASVEVSVSGGGDEPIPDDGKTRIWIHIAEGTPDNRLTFYLRFTASTANNTTVDWGDGVSETLGSTTATNYEHKYPSGGGDYVIVMTVNSGTISFEGDSSNSIYGETAKRWNQYRIYKIIFGSSVSALGEYVCNTCISLKEVNVKSNLITKISQHAFHYCAALEKITLPNTVTEIETYAFNGCMIPQFQFPSNLETVGAYAFTGTRIETIDLPDTLTTLGQYNNNSNVVKIIVPYRITSISSYTFSNNISMSEYHFKPTTPPSLASTGIFSSIPSDCVIYVPQGSLSAYQTATNWSQFSSKMQEEPV